MTGYMETGAPGDLVTAAVKCGMPRAIMIAMLSKCAECALRFIPEDRREPFCYALELSRKSVSGNGDPFAPERVNANALDLPMPAQCAMQAAESVAAYAVASHPSKPESLDLQVAAAWRVLGCVTEAHKSSGEGFDAGIAALAKVIAGE